MNDLLIALTARRIGAAIVTANLAEFHRIRERLAGLVVVSPEADEAGPGRRSK
jgi:predicted nucleic acid-binding protein